MRAIVVNPIVFQSNFSRYVPTLLLLRLIISQHPFSVPRQVASRGQLQFTRENLHADARANLTEFKLAVSPTASADHGGADGWLMSTTVFGVVCREGQPPFPPNGAPSVLLPTIVSHHYLILSEIHVGDVQVRYR